MSKQVKLYLGFTFLFAWILQGIACAFYFQGNRMLYQGILAVSMFAPLAALLIVKKGFSKEPTGVPWRPKFKGHIRWYAAAWFLPAVFTALGAVIYFVLFPGQLDLSMPMLQTTFGASGLAALASQGLTPQLYLVISAVGAITYAPLVNCIFGVGEEAGWRGFLYPALKEMLGVTKGRILGGTIWGIWHWPLIILVGFEYGNGYWGFPVTGLVVFTLFTVVLGILLDFLVEKTGSIWPAAICHGAFNAAASITPYLLHSTDGGYLLGPVPNGLISMIPALLLAVIISIKSAKKYYMIEA